MAWSWAVQLKRTSLRTGLVRTSWGSTSPSAVQGASLFCPSTTQSGADIPAAAHGELYLDRVGMPWRKLLPEERSPHRSWLLTGPVAHGGPTLEKSIPEGLYPVERTLLKQFMKSCNLWEGPKLEKSRKYLLQRLYLFLLNTLIITDKHILPLYPNQLPNPNQLEPSQKE